MANHNQVAHAWANQTGKHREGFNMFYDGPVIYSYGRHFPIARLVPGTNPPVVLFTSRSYSTSTAKHKSYTLRAIPSHWSVFDVANVMANSPEEHRANYDAMIAGVRQTLEKARRAVKHGMSFVIKAGGDLDVANEYGRGYDVYGMIFRELQDVCEWFTDAERLRINVRANKWKWLEREAEAKRNRQRNLKAREGVRKWLKHETNAAPHTTRPYVRVSADRTMIETSWGASVPMQDGMQLWEAMKIARAKGAPLAKVAGLPVGDFTVIEIEPNYAKVGCHIIPYRFACLAAKLAGIE